MGEVLEGHWWAAIRNQLLHSCLKQLAEDMKILYGEKLDTKTESAFQLALVVAQNHLVNVVWSRSMVQDNDRVSQVLHGEMKRSCESF